MSNDKLFKNRPSKKLLLSVLAVVLIIAVSVSITLAVLNARSGGVTNTFTPAEITIDIIEDFKGDEKTDVKIPNNGTTAAYIRASIVITWQDGNGGVYAATPVEGVDYSFERSENGWLRGNDGYWYWRSPVAPKGQTGNLIDSIKLLKDCVDDDYKLSVVILAQAIQAQGSSVVDGLKTPAVTQAWGIGVNADSTLKVQ